MTKLPTMQPRSLAAPLLGILLLFGLGLALFSAPFTLAGRAATVNCVTRYTVAAGDTLSKIAEKYKLTTAELAKANDLAEPYTLVIGTSLCIPAGASNVATATPSSSSANKSTTPSLEAVRVDSKVFLQTLNYPHTKIYYVRVQDGLHSQHVGRIRTDKKGNAQATFNIPPAMRGARVITVCIKDVTNDNVYCANAY